MNTAGVLCLIEQLEDNIDDLEENLEPLIEAALATSTKKLPLLDKAKLYVVVVYAIESLLFSYLRLHGVAAKEHPVFRELTRVKQYFEKIKQAEEGNAKPKESLSLDKQAANRFIKHALSGNEKYDLERAEREAREKFLAKRKLLELERAIREKAQAQQNQEIPEEPISIEKDEPQEPPDEGSEEGEIEEDDDANDNNVSVAQIIRPDVSSLYENNSDDDMQDETYDPRQAKSKGKKKRKKSTQGQGGDKLSKQARKKARKRAAAAQNN